MVSQENSENRPEIILGDSNTEGSSSQFSSLGLRELDLHVIQTEVVDLERLKVIDFG